MKYLLMIALLLAVPVVATAQRTDNLNLRGRGHSKKEAKSNITIGRVFLHDGSIINGNIVEADGKVSVTTFDGNLFVYNKDKVLRIEYGKVYQPKSGAVAVLLSFLVYPGIGDFYAGNNEAGIVWTVVGTAGLASVLFGSSVIGQAKATDLVIGGAALMFGARIGSSVTAYMATRPPQTSNAKLSLLEIKF